MINTNLINKYVIDPSVELTPTIRISPFANKHLQIDYSKVTEDQKIFLYQYLENRFRNFCYCEKARAAISKALSYYNLKRDDIVSILTTSDNFYISSCVTNEIEKTCQWSRSILPETKVLFVNHEFGYPYPNLSRLLAYNLPIIEDCAHTFFSLDLDDNMGKIGDFVIYSLPKAFPMQFGAILVSNKGPVITDLSTDYIKYIDNRLAYYVSQINSIVENRLENYFYLEEKLSLIGITPFFPLKKGVVPGVFLFRWIESLNYSLLKQFMQSNGVESSVFYGESAFFIPIHHELHKSEINYFIELINFFFRNKLT